MNRCDEITRAEAELKTAEERFTETVSRIQDNCDHPLILERPSGMTGYQYIENRWLSAVRVCDRCGYVEESRFGWPTNKTKDTPLYNTKPESESVLNRADFQIDDQRLHATIDKRS